MAPLFNSWGATVARSMPSREHPGTLVTFGGTGGKKLTRIKDHLHLHHHKTSRSIDAGSDDSIFDGRVNSGEIFTGGSIPVDIENHGQDIQMTRAVNVTFEE